MEKVTKYIANNGREFGTEQECLAYEDRMKREPTFISEIPEFMSPADMCRDPELAERYKKTRSRWG